MNTKHFKKFEEMFDRVMAIAAIKAYVWHQEAVDNFEYMRHDGDYITVFGTNDNGEMITAGFSTNYLYLDDKQIATLEEVKDKVSIDIKNTYNKTRGVYIGLKT